jgi:ferredoxin-NADP reductase
MQKVKFQGKETIAEGTILFHFEKPQGFQYRAGQSIDLGLIDVPQTDMKSTMRPFSLASAPHEPHVSIATRMRDSAFKNALKKMESGTELSLDGPFGSFFLHENTKRGAVFLTGGIGITPFRSIVTDAAKRKLPHKLFLFYSNRRPEDSAFLNELTALEEKNPNYKIIATMTEMEKSAKEWAGEKGYIDEEIIRKYVTENMTPIYYLAGPQGMVSAMRTLLNAMGVSDDDIRAEEFSGY